MDHKELKQTVTALGRALPSGASDRDLTRLAEAGTLVPLPSGWTFIHEGTSEDTCYIVLSGNVTVTRKQEKVVDLGPGAVIGEVAFFAGRLRNASVRTTEASELFAVPFGRLREAIDEASGLRTVLDHQVEEPTGS
jgi:CRP-like cAMP-binding protein